MGNFFINLRDEILKLNNDVKNVSNCEKAKALKKRLFKIGIPLTAVGGIGAFICFVLFVTAGFDAFGDNGFTARIIVPFVLIIPLFLMFGAGCAVLSYAFKIIVTGYTSGLVDETVGNNCPNCGDTIVEDEVFCSKCGTRVKVECPNCKTMASIRDDYCKKCGTKLEK